jgi:hypothetical protein
MRADRRPRDRIRPPRGDKNAEADESGARPPAVSPGFGGSLEQQAAFFHAFGALRVPGLFAAEIDTISLAFDTVFREHPAEEPDPRYSLHRVKDPDRGAPRRQIPANAAIQSGDRYGFIERSEQLVWLKDDPRVTELVRALLGDGCRYDGSVGNIFNSYIYWHSDYFRYEVSATTQLKLAFYLDELDGDSGALRVMPGTNHLGAYRASLYDETGDVAPGDLARRFGVAEDELPCWTIASKPGDVVVFDNTTLHANFNGGPQRRMFSLQFAQ